jgi:hypothetical protein
MKCHKGAGWGDPEDDRPDTSVSGDSEEKSFEDYESEVRSGKRKLDPNEVGLG